MDFLDYYRDNLSYIRTLASEFATEFPKIAARLNINDFECQDPYVERILEGTAFLAARVEKKLDDGYLRLLESLLSSFAPGALVPIPSGGILELSVNGNDEQIKKGNLLPRGTTFDAFIPTVNTPCRFSSFWDIPLNGVSVTECEYITRDLIQFGINDSNASAALRLSFSVPAGTTFSQIDLSKLLLYVNLPESTVSLLMRQLMTDIADFYVSEKNTDYEKILTDKPIIKLPSVNKGFSSFSGIKRNVDGLRLLQNFLVYPAFFKFFEIENAKSLFQKEAATLNLLITFKRRENDLVSEVSPSCIKMNCLPVLNLFPRRSDRTFLDKEAYEYQIVPDRTSPKDYEVFYVKELEFFNDRNETIMSASNFYDEDILKNNKKNFFSTHRRRSLFEAKNKQRSSYAGSEVFISFTAEEPDETATQFAAQTICTNRDLPLLLMPDMPLTANTPLIQAVRFLTRPTKPEYPLIQHGNKTDWNKISHIMFNLSAMLWQNGSFPLDILKSVLASYTLRPQEEMDRMLYGMLSLTGEPTTFRFIKNGAVFFESGWKLKLTLDEKAYAGIGFYSFALVLKEFLMSFTPINSLLEINLYTQQSGFITKWKTLESI